MKVVPPPPDSIGCEIFGFRAQDCEPDEAATLRELVYQHKLIVLRDQRMDIPEYIGFARAIGRPQVYFQPNYHHPNHPELFVSSNELHIDGKKVGVSGTGRYWHTDYQFMPEPLPMTMLYPQVWPENRRETYYIDMVRVLARMPAALRSRLLGLRAIQEGKWRYKVQPSDIDRSLAEIMAEVEQMAPASIHPACIRHPVTQAMALYVSEGFTTGFEGLTHEESRALLSEVLAFIERPEHIHAHSWGLADVLLWDNRTLLHKASTVPKGERSTSFRIGVYDGLPFYIDPSPSTEALSID